MTEDYLHLLWKSKRVPFHKISPINAKEIIVKNSGEHNESQKGPDFTFGSVNIDGIDFYGNIEIHVKSSDWYRHQHQSDNAYNNVILHVVYVYDKPVYQNGVLLPTIELKSHIDKEHFLKYQLGKLNKSEFPCENLLTQIDVVHLETMKISAFTKRMEAKSRILRDLNLPNDSVFYHLIASAFGSSINKKGFIELTQKIPFQQLKQISSKQQQFQLLLAESGLLQSSSKEKSTSIWHFKGTRPGNFPDIRLKQFAQFVSKYDFDTSFIYFTPDKIQEEFYKMVDDFWKDDFKQSKKISRSFSNLILINAVVPFMWFIGCQQEDERLQGKSIELLERLSSEKNKYMNKWKKCGVTIKNAFDSQSLLSLYQYHCSRKKCLTCGVGIKLLEE